MSRSTDEEIDRIIDRIIDSSNQSVGDKATTTTTFILTIFCPSAGTDSCRGFAVDWIIPS